MDERNRRIDRSEENDESEKENRYREKSIIAKTDLLFQLETLHLVLILEGGLFDLETLETLEAPFDFGG